MNFLNISKPYNIFKEKVRLCLMNYLMAHKKAGVKTHCKRCINFFVLTLRLHAQVSRV